MNAVPQARPALPTAQRVGSVAAYFVDVYRRVWRGSIIGRFLSPLLFLLSMGIGLGSLVVATRGTWRTSPAPSSDSQYYQSPPIIGPGHFWRDLLSLELRGIGLMVLVAVLAAA